MKVCVEIRNTVEEAFEETFETWVEKVERVCEDLPWPLDWFCKVVTSVVKTVVTIVKTIVVVIVTVVCYPLAVALALAGEVVNLILAIPIIGAAVRWVVGAVVFVWSQFLGVLDAFGGLIGIRPKKHLRLHVIILMRDDRTLTVPRDRVAFAVSRAESIFRNRADVKVHTTVHEVSTPSPGNALNIDSGGGLFGEDASGAGSWFQLRVTEMLWEDNFASALRIGAPVVAFVVDSVEGSPIGCSLGPLVDYVCVEGGQMMVPPLSAPVPVLVPPEPPGATEAMASATLAHEIGHACGLWHDNVTDCLNGDPTNLMFCSPHGRSGVLRGDNLSPFQRAIIRSSPHVTYL